MTESEFWGRIVGIFLLILNILGAITLWKEKRNIAGWIVFVFLCYFFVLAELKRNGLKNSDVYAVGRITFVGYRGRAGIRRANFEFLYEGKQYTSSTGVAKHLRLFEGDSFPVRVLSWDPSSSKMEFTQRLNRQKR